jgi:raffinose/stachyose/melibiose transport system substrate-binding protein
MGPRKCCDFKPRGSFLAVSKGLPAAGSYCYEPVTVTTRGLCNVWLTLISSRNYGWGLKPPSIERNTYMSVMRRRSTAFAGLAIASALVLSGCAATDEGSGSANCDAVTEVTWLNTIKIEIQEEFVAAVDEYNAVNTDCVKISIIEYPQGEPFFSVATPLYEAGNAPVVMTILQELPDMAERVMDWTGTDLAALAADGTLDGANIDGKQVGIPVTAEAFGLLYNKAVLDEAGVDPSTITTRDDLEAAFEAVEATGRSAVHFSGLWWSLGAHFTNIYHTTAAEDQDGRLAILDELKAEEKSLLDDPRFVDWLDTFDLMKDYSIDSASIADTDYDTAVANMVDQEVGFWFMGNWAEPDLLKGDPEGSYGVMPVPTSNTAGAYGNDGISVGVPFYIVIDEEQSTPEERAGAQAFISWLLTTPEGQARWSGPVDDGGMNFIPVYDGFTVSPSTFMATDIASYISGGKSLAWINSAYPTGLQDVYGAEAQKYYDGISDRAAFAAGLEAAWLE